MAHSEFLNGRRGWGLAQGIVTYSLEPIDEGANSDTQSLVLLLENVLEHEIPIFLIKFPL
jgi:hypothetical protein